MGGDRLIGAAVLKPPLPRRNGDPKKSPYPTPAVWDSTVEGYTLKVM